MAKTRLNNADRENIAAAIITYKFKPLIEANRAQEYLLADEAYQRLYPKDLQKKMAALGLGAFDTDDDVTVAVNGQRFTIHFGQSGRWADELGKFADCNKPSERINRPFFAKHSRHGNPALSMLDSDEFGARLVTWANAREDLRKDQPAMSDKVLAALSQFRTFDELLTDFPEAEAFIMRRWRERPEGGSPGVPSVVIKDLARALDLPPETQSAAA